MLAGAALVGGLVSCRGRDPEPAPEPTVKATEPPWMDREAIAQLIAEGGMPGPLFAGIVLGGPPPSAEARARVAGFARANNLDLQLDVAGDKLVAIRFDVSYGGCCGYEGADKLGLRLDRPQTIDCLDCTFSGWLDDWTRASEDWTVVMRASIRVNRVKVRWERALTEAELFERAEALIGQDYEALGAAAGDRWHELTFEHDYLLEVPYPFNPSFGRVHSGLPLSERTDLGLRLTLERRKIVQVSFALSTKDDAHTARKLAAATKRWGRPGAGEYDEMVWRKPGHTISACCRDDVHVVEIKKQ